MTTSLSLFNTGYSFNTKLYDFYSQRNPQKAAQLKKQQEAVVKTINESRYTSVTYDPVKQQAAADKITALQTQVNTLARSSGLDARATANKVATLTKNIAATMVEYVRAGGGRPDLIPPEDGGVPINPDEPNARPKPLSTFFVGDEVGKKIKKMIADLDSVIKRTDLRAQLRDDTKSFESINIAKGLLGQIKEEFTIMRNIRIDAVDIEV